MQEVAREQAIQQSNVEAMNNVKVSDGLSKWNKKAEPAKTITRRSKTQAQKLEEEQEAHRKAEFEKARRIEVQNGCGFAGTTAFFLALHDTSTAHVCGSVQDRLVASCGVRRRNETQKERQLLKQSRVNSSKTRCVQWARH